MKQYIYLLLLTLLAGSASLMAKVDNIQSINRVRVNEGRLMVDLSLELDSIRLGANRQLFISPAIEDADGHREILPAVLVNGRNMHYAYERNTIKRGGPNGYEILKEVRRLNGKQQRVDYSTAVKMEGWMLHPDARIVLMKDSCGCGHDIGSGITPLFPLNLTPDVRLTYITPEVTPLPVTIHEGRARVQFEVDKTELHDQPYICRNGQKIDNREQLQIIVDSINYALSDPNVEIASIHITGYASPESPYLHNQDLSAGRSRALSEYIAGRYNLPPERCTYDAVPENWREFRLQVLSSKELTETQRRDLLDLIDRPAYTPADYDAKERELKTSPKFASLYKSLILPKWFPELRATEFSISTRLKPLSDEKLAEIIETSPQLMSLNQMMRVAKLYEEGSDEFNHIIEIALKYYPDDVTANLNAAVAKINSGNIEAAEALLEHSGDSPEAENARGVIAVRKGDFDTARKHFINAGMLPEAQNNLHSIEKYDIN